MMIIGLILMVEVQKWIDIYEEPFTKRKEKETKRVKYNEVENEAKMAREFWN